MDGKTMAIIIDAILLAVAGIFVLIGCKRGLFLSIMKVASVVLSLILAANIAAVITDWGIRKFTPSVQAAVEKRVTQAVEENYDSIAQSIPNTVDKMVESIPLEPVRQSLRKLLDQIIPDSSKGKQQVIDSVAQVADQTVADMMDTTVRAIVYRILFVLLFILLMFLIRILSNALNLTFRLPLLRQLNTIGGGVLGLIEAALWMVILLPLIVTFLPKEIADLVSTSKIANLFLKWNPLKFL